MNNIELTQHMHKVYNSLAVSVIESDEKMTILFTNKYTTNLFGYNNDELLGSNVKLLMIDDIKSMHDEYVDRYLTNKKSTYNR